MHESICGHFKILTMSSLVYQPFAMSFVCFSVLVTVFCLYLTKRSCEDTGMWSSAYSEWRWLGIGNWKVDRSIEVDTWNKRWKIGLGWSPSKSCMTQIRGPFSCGHHSSIGHAATAGPAAYPLSSPHKDVSVWLWEHSLPWWVEHGRGHRMVDNIIYCISAYTSIMLGETLRDKEISE